eukprot:TRINITY_DN39235_c0_g1_i1.p1 TRINITY_DN39235_c0_g1~~TRINITY_DN39235_c0_g1_i1.p1  ORF type:complete len:201 (+),score=31.40 TRINITY_DN39235_c0_g1_i1:91-693(+)
MGSCLSKQGQRKTPIEVYVATASSSSVDVTPKSPLHSEALVPQTAGNVGEDEQTKGDHLVEFLMINQTDFPTRFLLTYQCEPPKEYVGPEGPRMICEEIISIPSKRCRVVREMNNLVCVKCIQGWELCSWENDELSHFRCSSVVTIRVAQDFLAEHTLDERDMGRHPMYMTLSGFERGNFCRVKSFRHSGLEKEVDPFGS